MIGMKDYPDQFDLNINQPDHIAMITICLRYLEWLVAMGFEETTEMFELPYLEIVRIFDPKKMEPFVEIIKSKRSAG